MKTWERLRREKMMIVLKLWSDAHRRTPIDIFVYEPFDFDKEYAGAERMKLTEKVEMPVVSIETLLVMKWEAGRDRDLIDINELEAIKKIRQTEGND